MNGTAIKQRKNMSSVSGRECPMNLTRADMVAKQADAKSINIIAIIEKKCSEYRIIEPIE